MNTLSWMIYLADVAGAVAVVARLAAFLALVALVVATICYLTTAGERVKRTYQSDEHYREECSNAQAINGAAKRALRITPGALSIALVIAIFAPSQNTIYAIAASEMGETALKSETGGKAVQALNAWLDRQIEGEPEQ